MPSRAVPAILIASIARRGFGDGIAPAMPLLAAVIPPVQPLPILILADAIANLPGLI